MMITGYLRTKERTHCHAVCSISGIGADEYCIAGMWPLTREHDSTLSSTPNSALDSAAGCSVA